jgi:hypothetical protein
MTPKILALVAMTAFAPAAQAATYNFTAPEFNGDGNLGPALIETWNVVLGIGEKIKSAMFESTFGNSTVPNTAIGTVSVGGVTVASCSDTSEPCWFDGTPTPISYAFAPGEFASLLGMIDLIYDQTDCCVIRLGESTLTIETAAIPLPAAGLLFVPALGGLAAVALRRRKTQA